MDTERSVGMAGVARGLPLDNPVLRDLFKRTRYRAEHAGLTWRLTLDEFARVWEPHWHDRIGKRLMLARIGHQGAYEFANVRVATRGEHVQDMKREERIARGVNVPTLEENPGLWERVSDFQRGVILEAIEKYKGRTQLVCDALGITAASLRYLRKKLDI